jgi:hypothetical protein
VKFSDFVKAPGISAAKIRLEIFSLGGRHQGDPLAGALRELQAGGLDDERRSLLRAVVAHLGKGKSRANEAVEQGAKTSPPARFADVVYIAVIIAAAIWTAVVINGMGGV